MLTRKDLEMCIMDNFRVKKILDFICNYRDIKEIIMHDYSARNVFGFFYQYEDVETIRIEEDTTNVLKRLKGIDDGDEDITILRIKNQMFSKHITIRVRSITEIEIDNCVIEEGITIENLERRPISVHVSFCIFKSGINLVRTNDYKKLIVNYSYVQAIRLGDVKYQEISIGYSEVLKIDMSCSEIQSFSTFKSHFKLILCDKTIIHNNLIRMDSFETYRVLRHINTNIFLEENLTNIYKKRLIESKKKIKECVKQDEIEEIKKYIKKIKTANKKGKLEIKQAARSNLLSFILLISHSDDLRFETEINAKLNYSFHKYKNNIFMRVLLYPVGYFYKPSRVIFTSLTLILLFGFIYKNIAGTTISLYDTIYFSGITFFTIGYSDVFDKFTGISAIVKNTLVLLEGGLGISLCSSLLASLMNKYINKY